MQTTDTYSVLQEITLHYSGTESYVTLSKDSTTRPLPEPTESNSDPHKKVT